MKSFVSSSCESSLEKYNINLSTEVLDIEHASVESVGEVSNLLFNSTKLDNISSCEHPSSILVLDNNPSYFYGEFTKNLVPYGRSDNYYNNPQNILVKKLERRK